MSEGKTRHFSCILMIKFEILDLLHLESLINFTEGMFTPNNVIGVETC